MNSLKILNINYLGFDFQEPLDTSFTPDKGKVSDYIQNCDVIFQNSKRALPKLIKKLYI